MWYPGLASSLVGDFERQLHEDGWGRGSYGTNRWVADDARAARITAGAISFSSGGFVVEVLPAAAMGVLDEIPIEEGPAPDVVERLQAAIDLIAHVEGLAESVGGVVQSCHVLSAERGYDVSHSTPALPLSIFVSVPQADERHAVLRLAESLVHEAMHLQLTLIESIVPLVKRTDATVFSPWKQSARPVQGLLHGLYVFAVIYQALAELARAVPETREYAEKRRAEITDEASAIGDARPGLTADGIALWEQLVVRLQASREVSP